MILRGVGYPRVIMIPTAAVVGMVHVRALPGTPASQLSPGSIAERAVDEAKTLAESGCDAVLLENMHDVPYLCGQVGPEIVAAMTTVAVEVRRSVRIPIGLQILAAANLEALAVAHAAALHFVRAEHFAYAHVADEGFLESINNMITTGMIPALFEQDERDGIIEGRIRLLVLFIR